MASKQDSKAKNQDQKHETTSKGEQKASKGEAATERGEATQPKAEVADKAETAGADDTQKIQSLIEMLSGDLGSLDLEAAAAEIDEWYAVLHKSKDESSKELASSLKHLKQLLKNGKGTGHDIGEALIQAGEQTVELGSEADKGLKTPVQKLGKQLEKIGASLGKAEDQEHIEQINAAVELLEGDLSEIDPEVALAAVDEWYAALHKSDDEHQKQIAACLKELKTFLKGSKKSAPVEALQQLGELTSAAASEAGRGYKGPLQKLGKALVNVSGSLK